MMRSSGSALLLAAAACAQPWSGFLDSSRAIDWNGTDFTIPNYTVDCSVQPSLTANDINSADANTTAIQNALTSCDATHNVVNIPAGTYYVAGWIYRSQGKQVVRGAGPNLTTVIPTAPVGCGGQWTGICMVSSPAVFAGNAAVIPPNGAQQCLWTSGYAKGTTTITLSSCPNGTGPPLDKMLILDQANDTADTDGQYICDTSTDDGNCTNKGPGAGNNAGRTINGATHSQKQIVYVTGVTNNGNGTFSVNISPGVYFNNIRSSQSPGAYWTGFVQNDGLESLTVDLDQMTGQSTMYGITIYNCYQCWIRNVRTMNGPRSHILLYQSADSIIRDSYLYKSKSSGSQSYGIEFGHSSRIIVENNIMQQLTAPIMFGQGSGSIVGYNFSVNNVYTAAPTFMQASYYSHNAGNEMNLWEGNNFNGIWADGVTWGPSTNGTIFRNFVSGWQSGKTQATFPLSANAKSRAFNVIGNVFGQPGYHNTYESYATTTTSGVNGGSTANTSVYVLGWTGIGAVGNCTTPPTCDPLVRSTLMRWGNYDVVTGSVKWDSTEASPGAVTYVNANYTSGYFDSLAHTLPASLYHTSAPSWWTEAKAWPAIGPDVMGGNLGTCSGTYNGVQATASSQCTGGTLTSQWAGLAVSIPAQDCYLNVMNGPPDGTGGVLSFDASACYGRRSSHRHTGGRITGGKQ